MEQYDAVRICSALAHETRLAVFRLLVTSGPEGLPAGDIAERVGVKANTLSNHLGILSTAGLVQSQRDGRIIRYAADYDSMQSFMQFMIEDCCNGNSEICAPLVGVLAACANCVEATA